MRPENAGKKQDTRFKPGQSGNPAGKAKGTRHKATMAMEALLEGEAEEIGRKAVELAKAGDTVALRLVLERVYPIRKGRTVQFDIPKIETSADVVEAIGMVAEQMAGGELTPEEASIAAAVLEAKRRAIETHAIEERLSALEDKNA